MEDLSAELRKIPPQQIEAEQSLLGGIMVDSSGLPAALEILKGDEFYKDSHRLIFTAIQDLFERNEPIDLVTVTDLLAERQQLESVGGASYIASLTEVMGSSSNVGAYAKIISEKAVLRRLIQNANEIISFSYGGGKSTEEILDNAEAAIFKLAERRIRNSYYPLKEVIKKNIEAIERFQEYREGVTGVPSHYRDLDKVTAGFQKSDLIILAARPSMGKCLAFDSEIVLTDGSLATIEEIYDRKRAELLTLKGDWTFGITEPSNYVDDGIKPVFRVRTKLGRVVESTITHPFLTLGGWRKLSEIGPGDKIAVPRKVDVFGKETLPEREIKILAYLLGDDSPTACPPECRNLKTGLLEELSEAIVECDTGGGSTGRSHSAGCCIGASALAEDLSAVCIPGCVSTGNAAGVSQSALGEEAPDASIDVEIRKKARDALALRLNKLGMPEVEPYGKVVPSIVFRLVRKDLALFLNRIFAAGGWASVLGNGRSHLGFCSGSEKLVRQIQHLLLRFGIIAAVRGNSIGTGSSRRSVWQLDVTESESVKTFISEIGMFGENGADSVVSEVSATKSRVPNRGLNAVAVCRRLAVDMDTGIEEPKVAGLGERTNMEAAARALSHRRLFASVDSFKEKQVHNVADSEIYWDVIVSIEDGGSKQVYDLTIPETHNFVANDICVHNTALALNFARNAAKESGIPVGIFSLEMSKEQLAMRLLCMEARVDSHKIRSGFLSQQECAKLLNAAGSFMDVPIYIDDTPAISPIELRAKARRMMADQGLGMVVVDYLQLMKGRNSEHREQEISEISRSLKGLAKELDIPVIALAQLNRKVEERNDKRPLLSDLRESGAIEQDADVIAFIYRDEVYHKDSKDIGVAEVIIGKQRNGPAGDTVRLAYINTYTRFENLAFNQ